jgi:hypothetical protein
MENYEETRERFLRDTENHNMDILKDDGLYRHLSFTKNRSSVYRFDIITWPGYLCICGDMGDIVFSRVEDMFDFFIMGENDFNKKNIINPHYWAEKIQGLSSRAETVMEFNFDDFKKSVLDRVKGYFDDEEKERECIEELESCVFEYEEYGEQRLYQELFDFNFEGFNYDCEIPTGMIYTMHYIWLCYAIVWAITEYNKTKKSSDDSTTETGK